MTTQDLDNEDVSGSSLIYMVPFRCGMVYVDPGQLGWKPYVTSWMQRVAGKLKQDTQVLCTSLLFNHP